MGREISPIQVTYKDKLVFGSVIDLDGKGDNEIIELLYEIFKSDFVDSRTYLAGQIHVDPISNDIEPGINKEKIFWHIISRKDRGRRRVDKPKACRINWIKPIITNHTHTEVKLFYYFEDNRKIRLYLWVYEKDFAVILQKLGSSSSYLVTSFYIDNQNKRDAFSRKYENYIENRDNRLDNCEWF